MHADKIEPIGEVPCLGIAQRLLHSICLRLYRSELLLANAFRLLQFRPGNIVSKSHLPTR